MATRTEFLKQLKDMEALIMRFGEKSAADVRAAGLAATGDAGADAGIIEGRKAAERLRTQLEGICLDTMLLQQPLVGEDLRFVSATFRIVSDLAQIDSMTRDVAFIYSEMPADAPTELGGNFQAMADRAAAMVEGAVAAFVGSDTVQARAVIDADDELDRLYTACEQEVVDLIKGGQGTAASLPELLMVAKYFERIGDKAQRVADWTFFRVSGERILSYGDAPSGSEEA